MATKRPRGLWGVGWACLDSALHGRAEHRSTALDYAESEVRRVRFAAGGDLGWTLSALTSPREAPTAWKVVVITGAPSWAEYWAPVLAASPRDWEVIVVDRPGYGLSEPGVCELDLTLQAKALSPLLTTTRGQRLLIVGQSYGAAIATLMAAQRPPRLAGLVLLSSYVSTPGPTARWLMGVGGRIRDYLPRDLRNAVREVESQPRQIDLMRLALGRFRAPVRVIHGDQDDFAPIAATEAFCSGMRLRAGLSLERLAGGGHFLNDGPADVVVDILRRAMPATGWTVRLGRRVDQVLADATRIGFALKARFNVLADPSPASSFVP